MDQRIPYQVCPRRSEKPQLLRLSYNADPPRQTALRTLPPEKARSRPSKAADGLKSAGTSPSPRPVQGLRDHRPLLFLYHRIEFVTAPSVQSQWAETRDVRLTKHRTQQARPFPRPGLRSTSLRILARSKVSGGSELMRPQIAQGTGVAFWI